jgi:hypothetical protein
MRVSSVCSTFQDLDYLSFGETHVLLISTSGSGMVQWRSKCAISRCFPNQYADRGTCTPCPTGLNSKEGSTDLASCEKNPAVPPPPSPGGRAPVRSPSSAVSSPASAPKSSPSSSGASGAAQKPLVCSQSFGAVVCRLTGRATGYKMHRQVNGKCVERCATYRRFWQAIMGRLGWKCGACP